MRLKEKDALGREKNFDFVKNGTGRCGFVVDDRVDQNFPKAPKTLDQVHKALSGPKKTTINSNVVTGKYSKKTKPTLWTFLSGTFLKSSTQFSHRLAKQVKQCLPDCPSWLLTGKHEER